MYSFFSRTSLSVLLPLVFGTLVLSGCDLFGTEDNGSPDLKTTGVFVANGGNFPDQNGTITVYDPQAMQSSRPAALDQDAFIQSIALQDGRLYTQINTDFGSGRVNILDANSYAVTVQSNSLGATRYVAFANDDPDRAYVSTLNGIVRRFNPETGALQGSRIFVGPSASELAATNGKVFATIPDSSLALTDTLTVNNGSSLTVFDANAPTDARSIELGCDGPRAIAQDDEDELVVICTGQTVTTDRGRGDVLKRTDGSIVFVDPATESVIKRIPLDVQLGSQNGTQVAHYDASSELLHAASSRNGQILRVDTDANALADRIDVPDDPSLTGIAAVAYDGSSQRLYIARNDVEDPFSAEGTAVVLNPDRSILDEFQLGPAPSHIAIRRQSQ